MAVTQGELMWTPPADARATSQVGRFMDWLAAERGVALRDLDFGTLDELWDTAKAEERAVAAGGDDRR